MKVLYYNIFLEKDGKKTDYNLSKLFDFINNQTSLKRTVKLGSQKHVFLHSVREPKHGRKSDNTPLENHEYIKGNRSAWIGKFSSDKPYEGEIGTDEIRKIDGDLFQPSTCLYIPDSYLFLMEYNFLGPNKGQVEEYLSNFIKSNSPTSKLKIKLVPIPKESIRNLLPASDSIKELKITIKNDGFQLSNLFPNAEGSQKTLLHKLFSNMVEVSKELDANTSTILLKKSWYKQEMDIAKIDGILKLLNSSDKNLVSAEIKFKNPKTRVVEKLDLKHDGFLCSEKTTGNLTNFGSLANLLTEHYYNEMNRIADEKFLEFGNLLPISSTEVNVLLP
ncbi:TPA: DUF6731 family protein [Streptococcus suis]